MSYLLPLKNTVDFVFFQCMQLSLGDIESILVAILLINSVSDIYHGAKSEVTTKDTSTGI